MSVSAGLTGPAKLKEVTRLMGVLSADLDYNNLQLHERDAHLEQLKVFGRDPTNSDPIFTREGIKTLTRHAFDSPSRTTSRNALRCLANAMLLNPNTRQLFVDLGYESQACARLKSEDWDDEFLVSRVIFLTTYTSRIDIEKLIDQNQLAKIICTNIGRHNGQHKVEATSPMEAMALIESLKLTFNLTHFCPQRASSFSAAIPHVLKLLSEIPSKESKPIDPPIGPLVNSLINLPVEHEDNVAFLFPESEPHVHIDKFIEILDKATNAYVDDELEQNVLPLLTLIRKIYESAPAEAQQHMRKQLLPDDQDRDQPLGKAASLSARLLRLSTNPATPQIRDSISSLLFELSDKDAGTFVQNVGYGYASGYLFQHKIPLPKDVLEARDGNKEPSSHAKPINPITGQTLESEPVLGLPEMTEEEKEREAERLFVLFERLKKTGVMNVQNPVETAIDEGRFEELEDDAKSE